MLDIVFDRNDSEYLTLVVDLIGLVVVPTVAMDGLNMSLRPCRCGCRHIGGLPESSCSDDGQTEAFQFLGHLDESMAERLVAATGGFYPEGSQDMEAMTWDKIRTAYDVMVWLEHGFLPNVWGTVAGKVIRRAGKILNRNLVVGGVRARQRRADLGSCNLLEALEDWYRIQCRQGRSVSDFGPLLSANLSVIDEMPPGAKRAYQGAETGHFDAHFDVERPLRDALETATYLRRNHWLTTATSSLELEALMLNGEGASFAILSITFQWLYDGGVTRRVRSHVFRAVPGQQALMDFLPEIIWLGMILVLLQKELWEVLKAIARKQLRSLADPVFNAKSFESSLQLKKRGLATAWRIASWVPPFNFSKESISPTFGTG